MFNSLIKCSIVCVRLELSGFNSCFPDWALSGKFLSSSLVACIILVILTSAGVSLCSAHSRGYKKLGVRFSNFPEAVRTVAALISPCVLEMSSSTTANFQVARGELSFQSTTSPLVGWVEDYVL